MSTNQNPSPQPPPRQTGQLVVGGVSHDFDFVRLELLKLLAEIEQLRITTHADYEHAHDLSPADCLISYTCDVRASPAAEADLAGFVADGGRWLALHASNAHLAWTDAGVASEHTNSPYFRTLGSAFIAHPPLDGRMFQVDVKAPSHPLVRGLDAFEVDDELYLGEQFGDLQVLLATRFSGETPGFVVSDWPEDRDHPILYLNHVGRGSVLYLNLGHARGHYDAPHRTPYYPRVERGAWALPVFYELLRRSIRWVARLPPFDT